MDEYKTMGWGTVLSFCRWPMIVLVLYVTSIGPAVFLSEIYIPEDPWLVVSVLYDPVIAILDDADPSISEPLSAYITWWAGLAAKPE